MGSTAAAAPRDDGRRTFLAPPPRDLLVSFGNRQAPDGAAVPLFAPNSSVRPDRSPAGGLPVGAPRLTLAP